MPQHALIDFDGTIVDFAYPEIGALKDGVKESLQKIKQMGLQIHIFSSRMSIYVTERPEDREKQVRIIEDFLDENEIPYDKVLNVDKPPAYVYIDDKAIGYRDNWNDVIKELEESFK
jgi:hypothetical protein